MMFVEGAIAEHVDGWALARPAKTTSAPARPKYLVKLAISSPCEFPFV
jgi:hypothetical protein